MSEWPASSCTTCIGNFFAQLVMAERRRSCITHSSTPALHRRTRKFLSRLLIIWDLGVHVPTFWRSRILLSRCWEIKMYGKLYSACRDLIFDSKKEPPIKFSKNLRTRFWSSNVAYATWPFMTCSCSSRNPCSVIFWGLSGLPKLIRFCRSNACLSASFLVLKSLPYFLRLVPHHLTIQQCRRLLGHSDFGIGLPSFSGTGSNHLR